MRCLSVACFLLSLVARVACEGAASCPCITSWASAQYENAQGGLNVKLYKETFSYPLTYGLSSCSAHDINMRPYCDKANPPAWCADKWCYIDPDNCDKPYSEAVCTCRACLAACRACDYILHITRTDTVD